MLLPRRLQNQPVLSLPFLRLGRLDILAEEPGQHHKQLPLKSLPGDHPFFRKI